VSTSASMRRWMRSWISVIIVALASGPARQ